MIPVGYRDGDGLGASPKLIARPIHRGTQGLVPDLIGNDLGDRVERRREILGMARPTMGAEQFYASSAMENPEGGHARVMLLVPHREAS